MLKGADIVLQCLRAEGVDLVFGYPGGAIMPLYDALEGSGVRHVLTRHEQGAVFAAEGYARVTGKVGVAMATSGPGATNLVTGIADAKMDSVPLVCITGQVRSALIGTDAFQETDVFGVTLSLTKWSRLVRTLDEIPEAIAEGFRHLGFKDDHEQNAAEWIVYDALYAYCQEMVRQGKPNGDFK